MRCWLIAVALMSPVVATAAGFTKDEAGALKRVEWTDSRVVGSPDPPLPYRPARVYEKLPLFQPVYLRAEPGTDRMFLVDHKGSWAGPGGIRVFRDDPAVSESEKLLEMDYLIYGFTFHPKYRENGYIYIANNGPVKEKNKQNRITRMTVDRKPPHMIVPDSEVTIIEYDSNGHNGGDLAFGPDGYLYCPTGDGTSDSDTLETGQGLEDLLAVMLRLDVDRPADGKQYSIPSDNPFINTPGARPEIWAYGFRNPWRVDYDHRLNQLWVTQNGQDVWEQVYLVRKGENYGWSVQEGGHPFYLERKRGPQPITAPTTEHNHSEARSLTGGIVYWGDKLPELQGAYIYGDFATGKIWGVKHDGQKVTYHRELADTTFQIVGFATNRDGELLVIDHAGGFYRLEPTPPETSPAKFPRKLSETGLFASVQGHQMHAATIPYSVNVQLWSDGADKERFIAIPGSGQIDYRANRGWNFPDGAVLVKSFALEKEAGRSESRQWIETRLMVKQQNEWVGYSYRWNDEQTDAMLVEGKGLDVEYNVVDKSMPGGMRKQSWHYPSRAECMMCHSRAANYMLGLTEQQMNREHDYGSLKMNQIELLGKIGVIKNPPKKKPEELTKLVDLNDSSASLDLRARSYLHANCSYCHVAAGGGNAAFEIEISTKAENVKLFDERPLHATFGVNDPRLVAYGAPDRSLLLYRMARRGHGQMPPMATSMVDEPAVKLVRDWIAQLKPVVEEPKKDGATKDAPAKEVPKQDTPKKDTPKKAE